MDIISSVLASNSRFGRVDTNGSGGIELSEFIANRPDGVTEAQATEKFSQLDTEGTGSLTASQLAAGEPRNSAPQDQVTLSDEALSFLLELTGEAEEATRQRSGADIFNALDTNEDGTLSEDEFIAGRPGFASEDDAAAEFARLDANEDGGLTFEEVVEGNEESTATAQAAAGPGGKPPPPPPGGGGTSIDEIYDELDVNEDGVVDITELMAGLEEQVEEEAEIAGEQSANNALLTMFERASNAYNSLANNELLGNQQKLTA